MLSKVVDDNKLPLSDVFHTVGTVCVTGTALGSLGHESNIIWAITIHFFLDRN